MNQQYIFFTGFFGAPVETAARSLASEKQARFMDLDAEIQRMDGRSVRRICMMMGEHEYRNKEFEALSAIMKDSDSECTVVFCGDGVLLDEMCRDLILPHQLVIIGGDLSADKLWEQAQTMEDSCHAFMTMSDETKKRAAFDDLYERQTQLFAPYL